MENLHGVVYGEGTVLLYNFIKSFPSHSFTTAILCPGNATWTIMTKNLKLFEQPYAMYHDDKVLVLDGDSLWCFMMMKTDFEANGTDVTGDDIESRWDLDDDIDYLHECSYILESHVPNHILYVNHIHIRATGRPTQQTEDLVAALMFKGLGS
ncbi:hypothetical protein D1007_48406 [Hordeum vulgare]|nr:hypothetical protein D1007_48406 [Hordeum vulgare]